MFRSLRHFGFASSLHQQQQHQEQQHTSHESPPASSATTTTTSSNEAYHTDYLPSLTSTPSKQAAPVVNDAPILSSTPSLVANFDEELTISKWSTLPVEFVEQETNQMIEMRNATVFKYSGLGVPDICILYKRMDNHQGHTENPDGNHSRRNASLTIGHFHWVLGQDVSSVMSISSYVTRLIQDQELDEVNRKTSWLFGRPAIDHKCQRAIYCTYNCLSRYDLRVEITLPGTVTSYVIDEHGRRSETITEEMWTETLLCSHLRYEQMTSSEPYQLMLPDNVRILEPLLLYWDPVAEEVLIEQAIRSFKRGVNTRTTILPTDRTGDADDNSENRDKSHGEEKAKEEIQRYEPRCTLVNNAFMYAMRDHFLRNCQYQQALNFFNSLMPECEMVTIHIAEVLRQMGDLEDAEQLITDHLLREKNLDLLVEECRYIIRHLRMKKSSSSSSSSSSKGEKRSQEEEEEEQQKLFSDFEYVQSLANIILQNASSKVVPWLLMAEIYAFAGNVEKAMSCLNVIPLPPDPEALPSTSPSSSASSSHSTAADHFCFYSANVNIPVIHPPEAPTTATTVMDNKVRETRTVPLWFSLNNYTHGHYVYNSTLRESHTKHEILRLKGHRKLIQGIDFTANNLSHRLLFDDPLVMDYNVHSIPSCSPHMLQKVIRTYAYQTLLDLDSVVGFAELTRRTKAHFKPVTTPVPPPTSSTPPQIPIAATQSKSDETRIKVVFSETNTDPNRPIHVRFSHSSSTDSEKVACQPWLRELLDILMQDLVELNIWRKDDTPMTSSDWYHRGLLAERLNLVDFALHAYNRGVAQAFHLKSYQRLFYLSTSKWTEVSDANIEDCFIYLESLLGFYLNGLSIMTVSEKARWVRLHPCVKQGVYALVAKYGLRRVRRVFNDDRSPCRLFAPKCMFMTQELMLECVTNKTYGFDM